MIIQAYRLFFLCLAFCFVISTVYEDESLVAALKRVVGVFPGAPRPGLERTVLITGCNHGFINHLENFKCFADRLQMKFLVIALDLKAHEYIRRNTTMDSFFMATAEVTGDATEFRSKQFNLITARKKEAVHNILELGFDVLFTDTDVALVRDPFPYLLFNDVDYIHSLNAICTKEDTWDFRRSKEEGNTGFYYVRSNNQTIKLWQDAYEAVPNYPGLDDQAVFWRVIRQSKNPPVVPLGKCRDYNRSTTGIEGGDAQAAILPALVTCVLDPCVFSSGMLSKAWIPEYTYEELRLNLFLRNESVCSLHANYIKGNRAKKERMDEYGFWLATQNHNSSAHQHDYWNGPCKEYKEAEFNASQYLRRRR